MLIKQSIRTATGAIFLSSFILPLIAGTAFPAPRPRLLSSDRTAVTFEIVVPEPAVVDAGEGTSRVVIEGYGTFSPPGAPELPGRSFLVAIPSTGEASVSWSVSEYQDIGDIPLSRVKGYRFRKGEDGMPVSEGYIPSDPWEGGYRARTVSQGEVSFMGRQRVLSVRVIPLVPGPGGFRLARRITVTVSLEGAALETGTETGRPVAVSRHWKGVYERLLVNPDDTERYSRPLPVSRPLRSPVQSGKKLKIRVPETGLYSLRADSLIAAGLSPDLSNTGFALKKYYYDEGEADLVRDVQVPLRVIKGTGSSPDIFEEDDRLVFYAVGIKDDPDAGDIHATFTDDNILWLEEDEAGQVMEEGTLAAAAYYKPADFNAAVKVRKDTYYHKNTMEGSWDFYHVHSQVNSSMPPVADTAAVAFTLNNPVALKTFSVSVRVTGAVRVMNQLVTVQLRNSTGTHPVGTGLVQGKNDAEFEFTGLASGFLADGRNELLLSSAVAWGFLTNEFEVTYPSMFAAEGDMLEFSLSPMLPAQDVDIEGFSGAEGYVVDITDPWNTLFIDVPPDSFTGGAGGYTMSLALQAMSERSFVAVGGGAGFTIPVSSIEVDSHAGLSGQAGPYHALVIAHSDFLPPAMSDLAGYVAWREEQGYSILTADIEDVFDEFNGGLPSYDAVERFVDFGFENWGVEFVLLVGDGNEDHKAVFAEEDPNRGTPPDFIPTFTFSIDVIGTEYDDEVVTTDKYYSFVDEPWPSEGYPDLFVGRMPVGEPSELQALLTKIRRFEDPAITDTWRRRVVLFADDAWSGGGNEYMYRPSELHFEQGMARVGDFVEESLPGGFDVQRLFLSTWTDATHEIGETGPGVLSEATDSTRTYFTPYLIGRINEGSLLFSFQGHANRAHFTTESGFSMFSQYKDMNSIVSDRNFIFFGAGCHISQFGIAKELTRGADGPNGDCITEQMLLKSRSGSVSTYASVGFEILDQNEYFFDRLHMMMFQQPPSDGVPPDRSETGAYWTFGPLITIIESEHIGAAYYGFEQTYRYVILGDPMLRVSAGPPLMRLEADWGDGWQEVESDTLRSRNRTNICRLRFTANDVTALGGIALTIGGEDRTEDLTVTRLNDQTLDYSRGYSAELDYSIDPIDGSVRFSALVPGGGAEAGIRELLIATGMRLFYNDYLEILPGVESPQEGDFRLEIDLPVFATEPPVLHLDGVDLDGAVLSVPDQADSTHWRARFSRRFSAGQHVLSVHIGEYSSELIFIVTGNDLVMELFNFPNPFRDGTNICVVQNLQADSGTIMIFNLSGLMVKKIDIPPDRLGASNYGSPNCIWWDGRDAAGDTVANGTYILLVRLKKDGRQVELKAPMVKLE